MLPDAPERLSAPEGPPTWNSPEVPLSPGGSIEYLLSLAQDSPLIAETCHVGLPGALPSTGDVAPAEEDREEPDASVVFLDARPPSQSTDTSLRQAASAGRRDAWKSASATLQPLPVKATSTSRLNPDGCKRCGEDHPDGVCRDFQGFLRRLVVPRYDQGLPEVEVSLQLLGLCDLDLQSKCFSAEFALALDWVDAALQRDAHYTEDYQTQRLKLFPAIEPHIFNPTVILDNAKEELEPLSGSDPAPRIQGEVRKGLWMQRRILYRGRFSCNQDSYRFFPVDGHALPIRVKSQPWGTHGAARLCHPLVLGNTTRRALHGGHEINGMDVHLGDLSLFGFGVRPLRGGGGGEQRRLMGAGGGGSGATTAAEGVTYEVLLFVRRRFERHFFTFFILSLMTLSGVSAFYPTWTPDGLTGRLSINVTVLLSMVAFCQQRPMAIDSVPYNTLYDSYAQFCTCMTACLGFANLATFLRCFVVTDDCDECVRDDNALCQRYGWCGSLELDCRFVEAALGIMLLYNLHVFWKAWRNRQLELQSWRAVCGDLPQPGGKSLREVSRGNFAEPLFFLCGPAGELERPQDALLRRGCPLRMPGGGSSSSSSSSSAQAAGASSQASVASKTQGGWRRRREMQPTSCMACEGETHFLDMGGGELGYYVYDADAGEVDCLCIGKKEPVPAFSDVDLPDSSTDSIGPEQVADAWAARLALLREHVVRYLRREAINSVKLQAGTSPPRRRVARTLIVGITGSLASAALASSLVADRVEEFVEELERDWRSESGENWELRYCVLSMNSEALFERVAICWLMAHCSMGLSENFDRQHELREYVRLQLSSWALLGAGRYGELDQDEFVEKMMPFAPDPTLERKVMTALEWFRDLDTDDSKTVTVNELLGFVLSSEDLLQALLCKRLFVGTLAGSTSTIQLTVCDPENEGEVSLYCSSVGNGTPSLQLIFPEGGVVKEQHLERWRCILGEVLCGEEGFSHSSVAAASRPPSRHRADAGQVGEVQPRSAATLAPPKPAGIAIPPSPSGRIDLKAPVRSLRSQPSTSALAYGVSAPQTSGLHLSSESSAATRTDDTKWPTGLRGVFIGISSMFYAAEAAGLGEHLVRKPAALAALAEAVRAELSKAAATAAAAGEVNLQEHQRKVANLSMAHAMIKHVLHDEAWLYFRRKWTTPVGRRFVATWSLGVFLSGRRVSGGALGGGPTLALARAASQVQEDKGDVSPTCSDSGSGSPGGLTRRGWRRRLTAAWGSQRRSVAQSEWEEPD